MRKKVPIVARKLSLFLGGILTPWLMVGALYATPSTPTNVVFSQVGASTLSVDWQGTTGTTIQFTVELASSAFVTPYSSTTFVLTSTFTALDVNTLYFARVAAIDTIDASSSAWTASVSTYTLANPPLTLNTSGVTVTAVNLAWDGNSNPAGTIFSIERSTDGISFEIIGSETATTYSDSGITPGITYSYRLRAFNNGGFPTAYSNTVLAVIPGSATLPRIPTGFSLTRTQTGPSTFQIDFQWHAVTERSDGSVLGNLVGYEIFKSTNILAPRNSWVNVSTPAIESWSTTTDGSVSYYALRTIDADGQESDWSRVLDDSANLNHFFMAPDFVSRVMLPQSLANVFLRANNSYGSDLDITVTEVTAEETERVARSLHYRLINYDTQSEITNPTFNLPLMQITLGYTVDNGVVIQGAPSNHFLALPLINSGQAADALSLYWFNSNEWVKTSGTVNTADNTITFTGARIGRFQIRAASHVSGLLLTRVYPRIISPNADGWNDKVIFEFDNPTLGPLSGKIYDLSNAFVAELVPGQTAVSTLVWDGKDEGGKVVPGGIYLYQIEQDGTPASGSIVVAR